MAADEDTDSDEQGRVSGYKGTRPGGRSARVREAVLAAAAAELVEVGYAELSIARVAQRAGVATTTVHRRWGNRARLVTDVFDANAVTAVPDPQRDCLEDDLRAFAAGAAAGLGQPAVQSLLRSMFSLPPEELQRIQEAYWQARFVVAQTIIDRAIARGELPAGTVGWTILEPLLAPIWMRRLITALPIDEATLDAIVADALLLARARTPGREPSVAEPALTEAHRRAQR
jgi:AcrR family transcriptional regulator